MFKNYFMVTVRNFIRNKTYSAINILGLVVGISCCIVIYLLISYELRFDQFHKKADQIYRVVTQNETASGIETGALTPHPFVRAFRNDFPEIPLITQLDRQSEMLLAKGTDKRMVEDVVFADSLFFDVFDFEVLSGNPRIELAEPGRIFVTESFAKQLKYTAGDSYSVRLNNVLDAEIVGIIKDPPPQSHLQFNMIVSIPSLSMELTGLPIDQWGIHSTGASYIVLPSIDEKTKLESGFPDFVKKYYGDSSTKRRYSVQPLKEIHFDTRFNAQAVEKSSLVILGVLGLFILTLACINFINLATAMAIKKSREIGIRKTLGAVRSQLTVYFLGETFLLTLVSIVISLGLVEWILPAINGFLERSLDQSLGADPTLVVFLLSLLFVVTVFSGLYPASILAGYNPITVLKNKMTATGSSGFVVRKLLVTFQFLIAQALIAGTLIVADQMEFFKSKPLGFDQDAIVNVEMPDHKPAMLEAFRSRLEGQSSIKNVSYSIGAPISSGGFETSFWLSEGDAEKKFSVNLKLADHHFGEVYGLKLLTGRWMTREEEKLASDPIPWDDRKYVVIANESAVKQLGFNTPEEIIGKNVNIGLNDMVAPVIGVVKDFHIRSFHETIKPVMIVNFPYFYYDAGIKIDTRNMSSTIDFIKKAWMELNPNYYFEYSFLDDHVATLYREEERTFTSFKILSGLSIFIACLGLYGLISFMANQKQKEVGIRKVLGASVVNIMMLFSKEFIKLIFIAFLIACPAVWYFMDEWLQGFAYRVNIQWTTLFVAVLMTIAIALATVSYRAIRAAFVNPANTLRTE
jgi:putative ABC transport system permease protein